MINVDLPWPPCVSHASTRTYPTARQARQGTAQRSDRKHAGNDRSRKDLLASSHRAVDAHCLCLRHRQPVPRGRLAEAIAKPNQAVPRRREEATGPRMTRGYVFSGPLRGAKGAANAGHFCSGECRNGETAWRSEMGSNRRYRITEASRWLTEVLRSRLRVRIQLAPPYRLPGFGLFGESLEIGACARDLHRAWTQRTSPAALVARNRPNLSRRDLPRSAFKATDRQNRGDGTDARMIRLTIASSGARSPSNTAASER